MKYEKIINNYLKDIELSIVTQSHKVFVSTNDFIGIVFDPSNYITKARYLSNNILSDSFGNRDFNFEFLCNKIKTDLSLKITNNSIMKIINKNDPTMIM